MENCDFDERAGMLALNRIFGFEPIVGKRLLETLGSAKEAFGMKREELRELIGPYPKYLDALIPQKLDEARKELEDLGKRGFRFLDLGIVCRRRGLFLKQRHGFPSSAFRIFQTYLVLG